MNTKNFQLGVFLIFFTSTCRLSSAFTLETEAILSLADLTDQPVIYDASEDASTPSSGNLKAIYFDGLPFKGNPTRVFAWLGFPDQKEGQVPGIVLVHGGGGTAFKEWVGKWNAHGFAAISIAVEGQTDLRDASNLWTRHSYAGPSRQGIYGDSSEKLQDQWIYHAVANSILANSLLRQVDAVDAERVGIMGISWGGVIAATAIGIDNRFAFAIPTYGAGQKHLAQNQYGRALVGNNLYKRLWDPVLRIERASMPSLWLSWPGDRHFPLDIQAATYRLYNGPRSVSLIPEMGHSHAAAWNIPESYEFAKSVVDTGEPWIVQIEDALTDSMYKVIFRSTRQLEDAVLVYTMDHGATGSRQWSTAPALLKRDKDYWIATADIPDGSTALFINVSSDGLTSSSEFKELM